MDLPLFIVNHTSFNNLMTDVDPKYEQVNRRDLTRSYLRMLHKNVQQNYNHIVLISVTLAYMRFTHVAIWQHFISVCPRFILKR
ncbi:hypothetical protein I4U23_016263 [Adineta vaga]|nr:hypothetical protein I4U23_016263 [Adineta vaga]